jgi:hypothetical protein
MSERVRVGDRKKFWVFHGAKNFEGRTYEDTQAGGGSRPPPWGWGSTSYKRPLNAAENDYHIVMTRLSPPTVYRCPACAGYFTRSVLTFLHFYDDVPEWSDGKNEQWWAGIGGPAGRCPSCRTVVWADGDSALKREHREPKAVGPWARLWYWLTGDRAGRLRAQREWALLPREMREAESLDSLRTAQDYVDAIAQIIPLLPRQEEHLRRELWWASNDHLRRESGGPALDAHATRANMERLLALLPPTASILERMELYRQLGRFQEALDLVPSASPDQRAKARLQQQWSEAGDSTIRVIPPQTAVYAPRPQRGAVV